MDILAALRQEEAKWKKQANAAQQQLDTVRAAMKLLGGVGSSGKTTGKRKRVLSAAATFQKRQKSGGRSLGRRRRRGKHSAEAGQRLGLILKSGDNV